MLPDHEENAFLPRTTESHRYNPMHSSRTFTKKVRDECIYVPFLNPILKAS
jgi:hypothetical protein